MNLPRIYLEIADLCSAILFRSSQETLSLMSICSSDNEVFIIYPLMIQKYKMVLISFTVELEIPSDIAFSFSSLRLKLFSSPEIESMMLLSSFP